MMVVRAPLKYSLQSKQRRMMTMRILQLPVLLLMSILLGMIVRGPRKYPLQSKQRQTMTLRILQLPVLLLMSILLVMIVRGPRKYPLQSKQRGTMTKRTHQKVAKMRPQKKTKTFRPRPILAQLIFSLTLNHRTKGIAGWSSSLNIFPGQQQGTRKRQFAGNMQPK